MWHVINPIFWQAKLWDLWKNEDESEEALKHIKSALNKTIDALEAGETMMDLLWQKSNVTDKRLMDLTKSHHIISKTPGLRSIEDTRH